MTNAIPRFSTIVIRSDARLLNSRVSINEPGSLAQITQVIADHDGNIDNVSMKRRTQDFTDMTIDLTVWDLKHLNAIIAELRAKRVVSRVDRITG